MPTNVTKAIAPPELATDLKRIDIQLSKWLRGLGEVDKELLNRVLTYSTDRELKRRLAQLVSLI